MSATIRIEGVILDPNKHIRIALQSIYGIGNTRALKICEKTKIEQHIKVSELTDAQLRALQEVVGEYDVEGPLRRKVSMDIKRYRDIKCYRGDRHRRGLPMRGQRTRTNARTRKGPRGKRVSMKSMGASAS
jgi:small subunit ribosomal protein S13